MLPGRFLSIGSLTVLTVLAASFGAWSATSAPPVAELQLRVAAENLAAASSFVEVADETESVIGTDEQEQLHEVVDFQAPNRETFALTARAITSTGQRVSTETLTQIGSLCWAHSTGGSGASLPCRLGDRQRSLDVLKDLENSTGVQNRGGTYVLSPHQSARVISAGDAGRLAVGMAAVEVRITGDTISWERVSFDAGVNNGSILIDEVIQLKDVGSAPRVVTPPGRPTAIASVGTTATS
jgi:hypothetical protein